MRGEGGENRSASLPRPPETCERIGMGLEMGDRRDPGPPFVARDKG